MQDTVGRGDIDLAALKAAVGVISLENSALIKNCLTHHDWLSDD